MTADPQPLERSSSSTGLPQPGSPSYLARLVEHLTEQSSFVFDEKIFTHMLLCLIMQDKHLILRTDKEDVKKVVGMAEAISTNILSLPSRHLRLTATHTPQSFTRQIFIRPAPSAPDDDDNSHTPSTSASSSSKPTPTPAEIPLPPSNPPSNQPSHQHLRTTAGSSSNDFELSTAVDKQTMPVEIEDDNRSEGDDYGLHQQRHAVDDSTVSSRGTTKSAAGDVTTQQATLHSNHPLLPSQNSSLRPLRPRSHLHAPSVFSTLSSNDHHPPRTKTSAMTTTNPATTAAYLPTVLILSGIEKASHGVLMKIAEMLRDRRVSVTKDDVGSSSSSSSSSSSDEEEEDDDDDDEGTWNLPVSFLLVLVAPFGGKTDDLISVPRWFLDLFGVYCEVLVPLDLGVNDPDWEWLPVLKRPKTSLVPADHVTALSSMAITATLSPNLTLYTSDLLSALLHHPLLLSHVTVRAKQNLLDLTRVARALFKPWTMDEGTWLSPEDVRSVFMVAVRGRVTIREQQDILMSGFVGGDGKGERRVGVEKILDEILEVV